MLSSFLDVAVHGALNFSISSQSSMRRSKDASMQVNRESCRDAQTKMLILRDAVAQVLKCCRLGAPLPRSGFPDASEFMRESLRL
jgi:hypothetical protein